MKLIIYFFSFTFLFAAEPIFLKDIPSLKTTNETDQYVYLIRHGESIFNLPDENGIYYTQGQSVFSSLTENGKAQALEIAAILQEKVPSTTQAVIASSTAVRACDTAFFIFDALSKRCPIQLGGTDPNLLEIGKGKWEGTPKNKPYYKEFNQWKNLSALDQWETPQVTTAESLETAAKRAALSLNNLIQKYPDQTLFIVSHGGTIFSLEHLLEKTKFSKNPNSNFPHFKYRNCDMLILKIPRGKSIDDATVLHHVRSGFPNTYK